MHERTADIIAFSELDDFIDSPLRTYSTGMVVRLGFSIAMHLEPDILLVDEVLAVGDARFRQKCLERMEGFRARNTTMVFVSHDVGTVARISDQVALLESGRLIDVGKPSRIIDEYQSRTRAA